MKSILTLLLLLITTIVYAQVDPLGIVDKKKAEGDGLDLRGVQLLAMDDWTKTLTYLDKDKLGFFYLDSYVSFIDYISGAFSTSPDISLTELAYHKSNFGLSWLDLYLRAPLEEQKLYHNQDVISELKSFEVLRYVDNDTRLAIYQIVQRVQRASFTKEKRKL